MGNKRWTRVLALVMALVCTLTVVAAVEFDALDFNKDGKVTVWDLQKWLGQENYAAALKQVLGGKGDELNPVRNEGEGENAVPVYEIWSEMGLKNMAKNAKAGYIFELKTDIDLGGKDWTPVAGFKGVFNGNDKTISNFKITKSINKEMGFFADTQNASNENPGRTKISNLNLDNVQIIVDAVDDANNDNSAARFIGALVGNNRGDIENCTAVSIVTDKRQDTSNNIYYGTLVGNNATRKNANNQEIPNGTIDGENSLTTTVNITKESSFDQSVISADYMDAKTVNSKMALFLSDTLDYATKAEKRFTGIAGATRTDAIDQDLRWQDITNSTDLADPILQERRELVAAEMYYLCTVEWTPASTMYYYDYSNPGTSKLIQSPTPSRNNYKTYTGGVTYKGIPYTHGSTGRDRFLAYVGQYEDANSGVSMESFYFNNNQTNAVLKAIIANDTESYSSIQLVNMKSDWEKELNVLSEAGLSSIGLNNQLGWSMYIGADCSSQAGWAWRKVSAVVNSQGESGFANVKDTASMFSMKSNQDSYGIQPVGLQFDNPENFDGIGSSNTSGDKSAYLSQYLTNDANNGENYNKWLEALAMTSKGDLLMEYSPAGGHTRLAISDAVVIYSYNGSQKNSRSSLDAKLSYVVTAEQGGGGEDSDDVNHYSGDGWTSSCCVDRRETFHDMTLGSYSATYSTTLNSDKTNYQYYDKNVLGDGFKFYLCWFPITCDALRDPNSDAGAVDISMTTAGVVTSNFHIVSYTVNGETTYTGIAQTGHREPITSVTVTANADDTVVVRLANGKDYTGTIGTAGLTEVK